MWRVVLKLAVSAVLLTWLLLRTPLSEIRLTLSSLDATSLFGALALTLAAWWISALRLWFLAPEFRLRYVVRMTFIALYYGTVLPGQVAGDVMKAYRLIPGQSAPGQAVAVTLIDRLVATFALFFLGACVVPWVDQAPRSLMFSFTLAATGIFVGMLVLARPRAHALFTRWLGCSRATGVRGLPGRLVDGLHRVLQHPHRMIMCFLFALLFHGLCVAIHMVLARSLGIDLPMTAWVLVYAGIALLLLLPVSIAGLGLREGGYVGLLAIFGVTAPQALSLSLIFFAYTLVGALLGWIAEMPG
jgi:uncharacterized membrane protein YbhN (UPF0104 family)